MTPSVDSKDEHSKLTDADLLKVMGMMRDLESPDTLWYLKVSWKRPIKRLKQEYLKWRLEHHG